jgi:tetratricopeptide (TPR) repeat protein
MQKKSTQARPPAINGASPPCKNARPGTGESAPGSQAAWRALVYVALIGATVGVYGQVCRFEFVNLDDDRYVTENAHVQAGLTIQNVQWAFTTGDVANWHPLTWVSYFIDYEIFGLDPGGYHLVNVFFHVLNALLLFEALRIMTRNFWPSAFVALLFALHPLHVESVAWIAERKDVLSTFFALLTLISYRWYALRPGLRRYGLVLVLFALGLMAKPMLVTLPCVVLLLDYWPLGRLAAPGLDPRVPGVVWWRAVLEKVPLLVLSAISSGITLYVQSQGTVATSALSDGVRVLNAPVAYVHYIGKMFWPFRLAVYYPYPDALPWWQPLGAFALLVAVSTAVLLLRRRYLVVGWLWYLGTLVPVIGVVQVGAQAVADRYTYVPLIGLFIMLAWGAADLMSARRIPPAAAGAAAVLVLAGLMSLTAVQARHWHDSKRLYEHSLQCIANNSFMQYNLGLAYYQDNNLDEAIDRFREALRITPQFANAQINLGKALAQQGRADEAVACFRDRLKRDPEDIHAHESLGILLAKQDQAEEAIQHLSEVARMDPRREGIHFNLANLLARRGRVEEAIVNYRQALRNEPKTAHAACNLNLGVLYARLGRTDEAMAAFLEAIRLDPGNADAHNNVGLLLAQQGKWDDAIAYYRKALDLNPANVRARENLREAESHKTPSSQPAPPTGH